MRPIFAAHCFRCHGEREEEGGLRLDVEKRSWKAASSSARRVVPGRAEESLIWQFATGRNEDRILMPPKGRGQRLNDAQCERIRRWIDAAPSGQRQAT